jgi:nitroimidazol reductase NimA-like FMN-containing flavoprotein (pyridoxamine 5'-phosphate oxidase superfamily)
MCFTAFLDASQFGKDVQHARLKIFYHSIRDYTKAALNKLQVPQVRFKAVKELRPEMPLNMTSEEIEQFLTCARVGRLGIILDDKPYVIPIGFGYFDGKIFFHTCSKGSKMKGLRESREVCFEVDEASSDLTVYKSVIVFGTAEIVDDEKKMVPYLQKLIDKYRVPLSFDEYMGKLKRNKEKELRAVRICVVSPEKVTGRRFVQRQVLANAAGSALS